MDYTELIKMENLMPTICDSNNLRNLSNLIKNVTFEYGDYKKSESFVNENTFVYFDPPYRPLSITSGFTSYTKRTSKLFL